MKRSRIARLLALTLIAVILAGAFVLTACTGIPGAAAAVPTVDAGDAVETEEVSASGEAVPGRWANLSFANGGTNLDLLISEGEQVTQGQPLAASDDQPQRAALLQAKVQLARAELALTQMQNAPTRAALAAAEAALANAKLNYDRLEDADAKRSELDAAQAQVNSAQAALDELKAGALVEQISAVVQDLQSAQDGVKQAETALANTTLKAPFDGQVVEILLNEFESAAPSQTVMVLADLASLRVETTDLSEVDVARIEVGDAARVVFDALPNQNFNGKVERIALRSSGGSAVNYTVTIALDELPSGLRWGMTAFVVFP